MNPPGAPIPGQTPLDDVSGLRVKSVRTMAELNGAEAENIRVAAVKYLAARPAGRAAPFDVAWMRKLHREMFGDVWVWGGELRKRETNIGAAPHRIELELHSLVEDLRAWKKAGMDLLEQGARLHHRAVAIHPFQNGNGRWARMVANIWLKLHGAGPIEWPEATIGTASVVREEYLAAIREADGGEYSHLIELHRRFAPDPKA